MPSDLNLRSLEMPEFGAQEDLLLETPEQVGGMPEIVGSTLVRVRGRVDGIVVAVERGDWPEILAQLDGHLKQSVDFFQGSQVSVAVGNQELSAANLYQLDQLLVQHGVRLWAIETTNQATAQAASAQKIAAVLLEGTADHHRLAIPSQSDLVGLGETDFQRPAALQRDENYDRYMPLLHRGTLRSGQVLRHLGPIVLVGDVNPGAEVISGSDIFIWGRLRGIAHAGATGSEHAVVGALDLEPTQLRIGRQIAVSPSTKLGAVRRWFWRPTETKPEVARVIDGQIVVEPWDERGPRASNFLSG